MSTYLDTAVSTVLDPAVRAIHDAAINATYTQAREILGPSPEDPAAAEQWNVAVQVLAFRIELAAGFDALGSVVGLRRWGVTWDVIGRAAGTTRQAAHARWGAQVRSTLDPYGTGEMGGPVADDEGDLV